MRDLPEADLRRMAESAQAVRFARGEVMVTSETQRRDTFVLWQGEARIRDSGDSGRFVDLSAGDVFGILARSAETGQTPDVVAITDCEVVVVDAEAAGAVASRNPDLTEAMNQLGWSRRRRLDPPDPVSILADPLAGPSAETSVPAEDPDDHAETDV